MWNDLIIRLWNRTARGGSLEAGGYSVDFLVYDWSLNERQAAK